MNGKVAAASIVWLTGVAFLGTAWPGHAAPRVITGDIAPLHLEEEIPVPNVAGRLDHFTADARRKRLFVSALGNNTVEVIDVFAGRVIRSIRGLSEPQGPLYVADFDKLYVANAGDRKVNVYDGETLTLQKAIEVGEDPDNVRYDAKAKKVLVGFGEEDGGIVAIDPSKDEIVGEVLKTGGHPESFQIEESGERLFVNVPDAGNVIESIDRKTGSMTRWPLAELRGNYAMALDEADQRLFTITRKTPMLVVLDTQTGKEVARLRAAGECDDVYYDSSRKRIYVIGGEGLISVFQQDDPSHYTLVRDVPSGVGIRTGYWFKNRDRLYVGVPAKGNEPAQIWTYEAED